MTNEIKIPTASFDLTSLSDTFYEYLPYSDYSVSDVAIRLGMTTSDFKKMLSAKKSLSINQIEIISNMLGISSNLLQNIQTNFLNQQESQKNVKLAIQLFPYLKEICNFKVSSRNQLEKVKAVMSFFNSSDIGSNFTSLINSLSENVAFRQTKMGNSINPVSIAAMIKLSKDRFNNQHVNIGQFSEDTFYSNIDSLRQLAMDSDGINLEEKINDITKSFGVMVAFIKEAPNSRTAGFAYWLNGEHKQAIICLTLRGKREDKMWFSLFHELSHLAIDSTQNFEGMHEIKSMQSDREQSVDSFAKNLLIKSNVWDELTTSIDLTRKNIVTFCLDNSLNQTIIIGRLQKEGYVDYRSMNDLMRSIHHEH